MQLVQGSGGSNPTVLGRLGGWDEDSHVTVLHGHYDVQPPGDRSAWHSDPFTLTGRDGYLYARGTSDMKGPMLAMILAAAECIRQYEQAKAAADAAALAALGGGDSNGSGATGLLGSPAGAGGEAGTAAAAEAAAAAAASFFSLKKPAFVFILEGEGENGSIGFREAVKSNSKWFAGTKVILNCNNTWLGEQTPCLTYGMRGMLKVRLTLHGAARDLHSGLDGGTAPEPLQELSTIIGSLIEPATGKIAVAGLYDSVAPLGLHELRLYEDHGLDFSLQEFKQARGLQFTYGSSNLQLPQREGAGPRVGDGQQPPGGKAAGEGQQNESGRKRQRQEDGNASAAGGDGTGEGAAVLGESKRAVTASHGRGGAAADIAMDGEAKEAVPAAVPSASSSSSSGIPALSAGAVTLLRRWREPSLTVHEISSSSSSDSVIPSAVSCILSIRTVPHMSAEWTFKLLAEHCRAVLARGRAESEKRLQVELLAQAAWWLQDPSAPHYRAAARAVEATWGRPPLYVREGGTVRVTTFLESTLHCPAIHIPLGQSSDGPHLPNERMRLSNLLQGMKVLQLFFMEMLQQGEE